MEDFYRVGVIASTHGVHGEVKVYPTTDDVSRFKGMKRIVLDTGKEKQELEITQVRFFKQMVILKFKEYNNINDIEKYKGKDLLVHKEDAVKLEEGEYFISDIIGAKVLTDAGDDFGILEEVLVTGANDVYVVKTTQGEEVLLPVIPSCVLDIDTEKKLVRVHILEGLLD